jgi:hypothetical protein
MITFLAIVGGIALLGLITLGVYAYFALKNFGRM